MAMTILGMGSARPSGCVSQKEAADAAAGRCCASAAQQRLLSALYRQSGVHQRGSVLLDAVPEAVSVGGASGDPHRNGNGRASHPAQVDSFYPPPRGDHDRGPTVSERMTAYHERAIVLAEQAASRALDSAGLAAADIAQLVTVTCTGLASPGIDIQLIDALGLPPTVGRSMIGFMGCHGAINGLRVANGLAAAEPGRAVLLCAVELCSLHFQYGWDPQHIVANALFADGAAAVVGVAEATGGGAERWRVRATGSRLFPDSRDAMTWVIGEHGFEMTLSPRVPDLIETHLRDWLTAWLGQHGLSIEDIGSWAIHPGGPRIVTAAERALGLSPEAVAVSRQVLAECGNMSSPTVLMIVQRLRQAGGARPCVALAFGPGLTAEAALLD